MQVYTPCKEIEKDAFFSQLPDTINELPNQDVKLLISDMKAQIDNNRQDMEHVIRPYRTAQQINENGK